ncbi:MAG: hypothetical protein L3K13_02895 [Thermoplasmata archaeon]|nr:hypothetical protein [Thermoplasmata archaeon]
MPIPKALRDGEGNALTVRRPLPGVDPVRVGSGRFRRWLGLHLAGDPSAGDRLFRRGLHLITSLGLVYYLLPVTILPGFSRALLLLAGYAVVVALEAFRLGGWLQLPSMRPHEEGRPASYLYFATAVVAVLLLVPEPFAVAAILGTALVDPLIGELKGSTRWRSLYPVAPLVLYVGLALPCLLLLGGTRWELAVPFAAAAALVAVAVESPKHRHLDDDLLMTILPALTLWGLAALAARLT